MGLVRSFQTYTVMRKIDDTSPFLCFHFAVFHDIFSKKIFHQNDSPVLIQQTVAIKHNF